MTDEIRLIRKNGKGEPITVKADKFHGSRMKELLKHYNRMPEDITVTEVPITITPVEAPVSQVSEPKPVAVTEIPAIEKECEGDPKYEDMEVPQHGAQEYEGPKAPLRLLAKTTAKIKAGIKEIESVEVLEALKKEEMEGKKRIGAINALEERIYQLTD